ncbi:HPF/RaiA family ribosome-associated protein [Amycolatopsis carbonis]|uniref:HPF/RaiA family ribosome-associated protein n=1 Tax=Amycolatopsis carbonis TaxID=715471 RepID=A0A9Y2ID38_9PSEU|nr:HPF/RaiA family ribosome-associated protein [Amycolatopsis sp. 2-15]WIX76890.1 HPF/RaiA family ribosome-associated protein [Amycolatopsis sp. 2-15]
MEIQISTDSNLSGGEDLIRYFEVELESKLARFSEHLTTLDVHLSDEMGGSSDGEDRRCVIEARPAGRQPVIATQHAGSVPDAFNGAVQKLERGLEKLFGRAAHHKGGESIRHMKEDQES